VAIMGEMHMAKARKRRKKSAAEPPQKRRLTELRGMFPATKRYVGVEVTRQDVARQLGKELDRKARDR
jgi:hypothetical protein